MKKLMKAIAFATVMCMLLSVSAFANLTSETVVTDYKFTVNVNTGETSNQVALLVTKTSADIANLSDGDILFIDQKASDETNKDAPFADIVVDAEDVDENGEVKVYAGYANNTESTALSINVDVVTTKEITVVLGDEGITVIPDATAEHKKLDENYIPVAETDYGALVYAKVTVNNLATGDAVKKVGWKFTNGSGETAVTKVIDYDCDLAGIAGGSQVQLGVAFTNGNGNNNTTQTRAPFVTTETDVQLWFGVQKSGAEGITSYQATKQISGGNE